MGRAVPRVGDPAAWIAQEGQQGWHLWGQPQQPHTAQCHAEDRDSH